MDKKSWKKKRAKYRRCNCRGRKHGNPKYGDGICRCLMRKAVKERIRGKRFVKDGWMAELVDAQVLEACV